MVELQVAILLLTFGIMTLASLMTTQNRLLHRVRGDFQQDATLCVTRSIDPWVRQLGTPARITVGPITQSPPPAVNALNEVVIVSEEHGLTEESITVTADATEIP